MKYSEREYCLSRVYLHDLTHLQESVIAAEELHTGHQGPHSGEKERKCALTSTDWVPHPV